MSASEAAATLPHADLDGLGAGGWHEQRCRACGALVWHPRLRCPACWAADLAWTTAAEALGVVVSHATVHRPHDRRLFATAIPITLVAVARQGAAPVIAVGEPQARAWRIGEPVRLRMERLFSHGLLVPVATPDTGADQARELKEEDQS